MLLAETMARRELQSGQLLEACFVALPRSHADIACICLKAMYLLCETEGSRVFISEALSKQKKAWWQAASQHSWHVSLQALWAGACTSGHTPGQQKQPTHSKILMTHLLQQAPSSQGSHQHPVRADKGCPTSALTHLSPRTQATSRVRLKDLQSHSQHTRCNLPLLHRQQRRQVVKKRERV